MTGPLTQTLKLIIVLLMPMLITIGAVALLTAHQYLVFEDFKESFPPDPFGFTEEQRFQLASSNIH